MLCKLLSGIAFIVISCFAQTNWTGYLDTVAVSGLYGTETVYGRALVLTDYEDMEIAMKVDDTTSSGFAGDSCKFHWGYQTGACILNSSGVKDTVWQTEDMVVLDTCLTDSFGLAVKGYQEMDGTIHKTLRAVDTTSITGWAVQKRWVVPMWDIIIRPWAQGLAVTTTEIGNVETAAKALKLQFDFLRRVGTRVE